MAGSQQSIINEWRDRAIEEGGQVRLPHSTSVILSPLFGRRTSCDISNAIAAAWLFARQRLSPFAKMPRNTKEIHYIPADPSPESGLRMTVLRSLDSSL